VKLIASTLTGNTGSIGPGGAIFNGSGADPSNALTLVACTLSSNTATAGGGIYQGNGTFGNSNMTVVIRNTILKAGNSGGTISNEFLAVVISDGYNLSSDDGGGVLTNATDQINTDPLLGPLASNGGPTVTHKLLPGSPAIDQGKSFGLTTDQRGRPRPYDDPSIANAAGGDGSDIGAYEAQPDSVGDGIPDSWRAKYFGGLGTTTNSQSCALCDPDGDGQSNLAEYIAGFNPTNAAAVLHIISIAATGNDIKVTYLGANGDNTWSPGVSSRTNVLEFTNGAGGGSASNNYASTGQTNILSGGTGLGVVTNMVDIGGATIVPARYYRVLVLPP